MNNKLLLNAIALLFTASTIFIGCSDANNGYVSVTGVELNENAVSLYVDETKTLRAAVLPLIASNRNITWSANNAHVTLSPTDCGEQVVVTAVSAGTSIVTVTTQDGGYYDTATITVTQRVPVTGVELNYNAATLYVGDDKALIATVLPLDADNQNVTWSVDNAHVTLSATTGATVTVTAATAGTSVVTVTTEEGSHIATAIITVTSPVVTVPVTSVTLNYNAATLTVGGEKTLVATVLPAEANQNVTWSTNNAHVTLSAITGATVTVTAATVGTSIVTVTTEEGGLTATATITVNPAVVDADQYVLIAGTRWATRNVATVGTFAASPQSLGLLYQWGVNVGWAPEVLGAPSVDGATWQTLTDLNAIESWNNGVGPCPQGWRLPVQSEFQAILDVGPGIVGTVGGTPGRWFPGAPGATLPGDTSGLIFIPGAGRFNADRVWAYGLPQGATPVPFGMLWTSTIQADGRAARFSFRPSAGQATVLGFDNTRAWGFSVRCVQIVD